MNLIVLWSSHQRVFSSAAISAALLLTCMSNWNSSSGNSSAQTRKRTVIIAVSAESGEGSMDAVAILEGKQLRSPYSDEQKDKQKTFGNEYFKNGTVYRLVFGGGDAG